TRSKRDWSSDVCSSDLEEDIYTVSSYASSQPKVKLGAVTGEQYRMKDLLYSLMLESHNDAAVIIAEGVAGSVEAFAALMNQKAQIGRAACRETGERRGD